MTRNWRVITESHDSELTGYFFMKAGSSAGVWRASLEARRKRWTKWWRELA
jgi:hypothetical protein